MTRYIEDDDEIFGPEATPGADEPYRNLSEVPDAPPPVASLEQRTRVADGLVADRENARYTDEVLRSRYDDVDRAGRNDIERPAQPEVTSSPAAEPDRLTAVPRPDVEVERRVEPVIARAEPEPDRAELSRARDDRAPDRAVPERRMTAPVDGGIEPASRAVLAARDAAGQTTQDGGRRDDGRRYVDQTRTIVEEPVVEGAPTIAPEPARDAVRERADEQARRAEEAVARLNEQRKPASAGPADRPAVTTVPEFKAEFEERLDASAQAGPAEPEAPPIQVANVSRGAATGQAAGRADAGHRRPGPEGVYTSRLIDERPNLASVISASGVEAAGVSFQATTVFFGDGSARLSNGDRTKLKQVAQLHQELGGVVRVIGHSSRRTRDMPAERHKVVNLGMSLDRAQAVSRELGRLGVPATALIVSAAGDSQPVAYEYMPGGEAQNRRAEVFIEY